MAIKRRELLAACGLGVAAAAFSDIPARMLRGQESGEDRFYGHALSPEFSVDKSTGELTLNPEQQVSYTMCTGCTTFCGVRVRVDKSGGRVLRVAGNPYNPLAADPHLPMSVPVRESFKSLSALGRGLSGRAAACGRGNAILEHMESPRRVLRPLKRVGPRNSGRWQAISFEQLVRELVEGGDLFGEGHVPGLAKLRDLKNPISPEAPEFGPQVNQVAVLAGVNDGREAFARRFWNKAYGTLNFVLHGSYCGGSYRSGSGALFGDHRAMPHGKPDLANAEFVLFIGTAPGNAGNPFMRTGRLVAEARSLGALNYVVVDPVLTNADSRASGERSRWVPILPGTDGALVMGMMRWMFENGGINSDYLACPNLKVAESRGHPSFSSASWLVITAEGHGRYGRYLRGSDLGLPLPEDKRYGEEDPYMALDAEGGFVPAGQASGPCRILPAEIPAQSGDGQTDLSGLGLKTALQLLHESAFRHTPDEYAASCGVPEESIAALAREFTAHGPRACAVAHGGMMSGSGFYNAYGVVTLNALIGSLNQKGGFVMNGGGFQDAGAGPRYNLDSFPGQVKPRGMPLGRNAPYERSSEFKKAKEQGRPYPARDAWFPNAPGLATEWFPAALRGYPYPLKALVLLQANPLYGIPGLSALAGKDLADPKKLPLILSVDTLINESNAYADYIVPDSLLYESWGWLAPWNGVPTKSMSARWPVLEPKMEKTPDGRPIGMESFFIALALAMKLPGFGPEGLSDAQGRPVALECAEDWYLRGGANIAFLGEKPAPEATEEDISFSGVDRIKGALTDKLTGDEWRRVAFLYTRGGRFQGAGEAQDKERPGWQNARFKKVLWIWNEQLGSSRNSLSGKRFWGCAQWVPPSFADGSAMRGHFPETEWPMLLVSYKSALHNACSVGTSLSVLKPDNPMLLHPEDAAAHGLSTGDLMRVTTPGGTVRGTVIVHAGVMRGVVGIEHGYGHKELGARAQVVDGKTWPGGNRLDAGVNLNDLGLADPSRGKQAVWVDAVSGACVRNGLPAKIRRG